MPSLRGRQTPFYTVYWGRVKKVGTRADITATPLIGMKVHPTYLFISRIFRAISSSYNTFLLVGIGMSHPNETHVCSANFIRGHTDRERGPPCSVESCYKLEAQFVWSQSFETIMGLIIVAWLDQWFSGWVLDPGAWSRKGFRCDERRVLDWLARSREWGNESPS